MLEKTSLILSFDSWASLKLARQGKVALGGEGSDIPKASLASQQPPKA